MKLSGFFKRRLPNSLDSLSEQKKMFLVNYLGDRSITWRIDGPVKERYPDIERNIEDLQKVGLIKKEKGVYILTPSGQEMRKLFRTQERARREQMHQSAVSLAMVGNYLEAYNTRARYEKSSVIPHGVHVSLGGDEDGAWAEKTSLPYNVQNYIKASYKLDFSDCRNSEAFKDAMRSVYVRIYNFTSTRMMDRWDGQFLLGMYDCTKPFHATMSQYDKMKAAGIAGFPKTFRTFEKHKKANDAKYKAWMDEYSRIKGEK